MSLPDTDPQKYHLRIPRLLEVQRRIAANVSLADSFSTDFVAGVDQAFLGELIISGAVLLNVADQVIARASSAMKAALPYVPGLLSFREGPAAIRAVKELRPKPTLLFVDGCGINHPRRAGLASFIGIMLDLPTIGISKRVLCGEGERRRGQARPLPLFSRASRSDISSNQRTAAGPSSSPPATVSPCSPAWISPGGTLGAASFPSPAGWRMSMPTW